MIRPATPDDLEPLLDLWVGLQNEGEAADSRYRSAPDARSVMRSYMRTVWLDASTFHRVDVFEQDGLGGFIQGFPMQSIPVVDLAPSAMIGDLYVHPNHRRQGMGRALVQHFSDRAKAAGYPRLQVGTLTADQRAVAFWRRMGFGDWQVSLSRLNASFQSD